jgi:hypothetical protein
MRSVDLPTDDVLLANVVSFLIEGREFYEANLLLLCDIKTEVYNSYRDNTELIVEVLGSRGVYEIVRNNDQVKATIVQAFNAVLPRDVFVEHITSRVPLTDFDSSWRSKLTRAIEDKEALNQGIPIKDGHILRWENLNFRSPNEINIAKALNEYEVFFLPNCMARFGSPTLSMRKNREADFLVCYDGKWGIIEVDGETYHTNAARDHERDRLFRSHGIRVIERYTAEQCAKEPQSVVRQFLALLKKNG